MGHNRGWGCIGPLIGWAIILFPIIALVTSDLYNHSQIGMIKNARKSYNEHYYERYLSEYPNGKYVDEVYDSIFAILKENPGASKVLDYTKKYSGTPLAKKLADMAYQYCIEINSIYEWRNYVENIDDRYLYDAKDRLSLLQVQVLEEEKKLWETEAKAWQTTNKNKDLISYRKYLSMYPNGKHSEEVKKMLIDYEVAQDFSGTHSQMPPLEKTGGYGKRSNIIIENQTSYVLTILYSGHVSDKLTISPHSSGNIRLPNGNYRISAKVSSANVIPFVGTESLTGGEYHSSYYITSNKYRH